MSRADGPAPDRWLTALLAALLAGKAAVAVWGLGRGFEMGDEGFYLLNLNHPERAPHPFEFYRLLGLLDLRFGVLEARALRLAAEAVGSAVLVGGAWAWARARVFPAAGAGPVPFALFALLGALLGVGSRSLSYNDVGNLFTYSAVGLFLLLAARPRERAAGAGGTSLALASGALAGLQLSVKFPTALLLAAVLGALVAGLGGLSRGARARLAAALGTGFAVAALAIVAAQGGAGRLLARLEIARRQFELGGYTAGELLVRYASLDRWTWIHLLAFALAAGGALAVRRRLGRGGRPDADLLVAWLAGVASLVLAVAAVHPAYLHPSLVVLACLLGFAAPAAWVLQGALRPGPDPETRRLLLLPLALPPLLMLGTNVPLTVRLPTHALPLFVVVAVVLHDLRARGRAAGLHRAVACVLAAASAAVFVQHQWREPYGLPRPLPDQRHRVEGLPGIRVDAATRRFLEDARALLAEAGFRPGDPLVALEYMPGLVFYLGGTSPGFPFFLFDQPRLNCFNLGREPLARPPFLVLGRPLGLDQWECIRTFDFPDDFRFLGALRFPYERVYAGFGAEDVEYVRFYAPRAGAR